MKLLLIITDFIYCRLYTLQMLMRNDSQISDAKRWWFWIGFIIAWVLIWCAGYHGNIW